MTRVFDETGAKGGEDQDQEAGTWTQLGDSWISLQIELLPCRLNEDACGTLLPKYLLR